MRKSIVKVNFYQSQPNRIAVTWKIQSTWQFKITNTKFVIYIMEVIFVPVFSAFLRIVFTITMPGGSVG